MRIVIADDHDIFRQSLSMLLAARSQHEIVGDASTFIELVDLATQTIPDCILVDYHMPGGKALEVTASLQKQLPDLKIVMLTGTQAGLILKNLADGGVHGIVHKRDDADTIVDVINLVEKGERFLSQTIVEFIESVNVDFTQREFDVLQFLVDGESPAKIAELMSISARTVEKHKQNMMQKTGLSSVLQLIELGHRLLAQD